MLCRKLLVRKCWCMRTWSSGWGTCWTDHRVYKTRVSYIFVPSKRFIRNKFSVLLIFMYSLKTLCKIHNFFSCFVFQNQAALPYQPDQQCSPIIYLCYVNFNYINSPIYFQIQWLETKFFYPRCQSQPDP